MSYVSKCSEILDLFKLTGKEIPTEDSDMGRAVQILQTICDNQSHTIPASDFSARINEMEHSLFQMGWKFFHGNAACNPYAENKNAGILIDASDILELQCKVLRKVNPEHEILEEVEIDTSAFFESLEELESKIGEDDFQFEFDGNEYRLIGESGIWDIYRDAIQELVEDCYSDVLKLDNIPAFIAFSIDWEETAKNAYADGYGHTFSSYDGSEEESAGYYIFRTN